MNIDEKLKVLKDNLKNLGDIAIGFSGGVDSTFLLKVAFDVLGNKAIAVTAKSSTFPQRELQESIAFAKEIGINQEIIVSEELEIEGFSDNPHNRCYYCKLELFKKIKELAQRKNIVHIADGSNLDDDSDYRPGVKALKELGVKSPLKEAFMTKNDIRELSRRMGLKTWDKPAFACLSSRFPYGHKITKEKLGMVGVAEQYLIDLGFKQIRVRCHDDIARIEVPKQELEKFFNLELMERVYSEFKKIGFTYTSLDLRGYRMGSMNEVIGR